MKRRKFEDRLGALQLELDNLARWLQLTGHRMVVVVEGRDAAGKGGVIKTIVERLNTRQVRVVALGKPSERERTEWYFQRFVRHLPSAGELVLFDRSWYNRAGVEKVMDFCSHAEYRRFLKQAPAFERLLIDDGILLLKYWLSVDQEEQEARFAERAADPLKRWKISPIDLEARTRYEAYGRARDAMFRATHTRHAPWCVVSFNDQREGRLALIRHLLDQVPDTRVPPDRVELPPLASRPRRERFRTPLKPINA